MTTENLPALTTPMEALVKSELDFVNAYLEYRSITRAGKVAGVDNPLVLFRRDDIQEAIAFADRVAGVGTISSKRHVAAKLSRVVDHADIDVFDDEFDIDEDGNQVLTKSVNKNKVALVNTALKAASQMADLFGWKEAQKHEVASHVAHGLDDATLALLDDIPMPASERRGEEPVDAEFTEVRDELDELLS